MGTDTLKYARFIILDGRLRGWQVCWFTRILGVERLFSYGPADTIRLVFQLTLSAFAHLPRAQSRMCAWLLGAELASDTRERVAAWYAELDERGLNIQPLTFLRRALEC